VTIAGALNALTTNPGFKQLTTAEQALLNRRVSSTAPLSQTVRFELNVLMGGPAFNASGSPEAQASALRTFISAEIGTPDVVASNATEPTSVPAYAISDATPAPDFAFDAGQANATRFTVTVEGKAVNVIVADHAPDHHHTIEQVAKGLAALPAQSLALVHEVQVEPDYNPTDAHWAQVYSRPDFHSYMTAGADGDVRIYPTTIPQSQAALDGSLIHETGHVLSKREFGEDSTQGPKWAAWNAAAASDGTHPSQYAKSSGDEDFAESLELYQQVRGSPREAETRKLFPARFAILDELTP
jgi:hypothetical protein